MYKLDYNTFAPAYKDDFYCKVSHNALYYINDFLKDSTKEPNTICCLNKLKEEQYLKNIILGDLVKLRDIIHDIEIFVSNSSKDNLKSILYKIFVDGCYEHKTLVSAYTAEEIKKGCLERDVNCINKSVHIKQLGLRTCPYCNRNYIFSIEINRQSKIVTAKPQLDHFFPKSSYPYLGASLYNLIPSCNFCNGLEVKGELEPITNKNNPKDSEIIMNPYEFDDENFYFSYKLSTINTLNITESDMEILYKGKQQYINGYEHIFGIQSLYNGHKDIIIDLIRKYALQYPESNKEYINKIFCNIPINDKTINHIFFGFEEDSNNHHLKPFSKFMNDIYKAMKDDEMLKNIVGNENPNNQTNISQN